MNKEPQSLQSDDSGESAPSNKQQDALSGLAKLLGRLVAGRWMRQQRGSSTGESKCKQENDDQE